MIDLLSVPVAGDAQAPDLPRSRRLSGDVAGRPEYRQAGAARHHRDAFFERV